MCSIRVTGVLFDTLVEHLRMSIPPSLLTAPSETILDLKYLLHTVSRGFTDLNLAIVVYISLLGWTTLLRKHFKRTPSIKEPDQERNLRVR